MFVRITGSRIIIARFRITRIYMDRQCQNVTKMRMDICSAITVNMDRKLISVRNAVTGHPNRLGNDDKNPM